MAEVLTVLRIEITGDNGVAGHDTEALRALLAEADAAALGDRAVANRSGPLSA